MNRTSAVTTAALLALTTLTACGGKPEGCIDVGRDVAQAIVDGAAGDLSLYVNSGKAIRAASGVYYVAYKVDASGDAQAVWAMSEVNPPQGPIMSADAFAANFTNWPQMEGANGSQSMRDATACLD